MIVNNIWKTEKNGDTFYSPISKYAYLTPLQRKKLREKRKLEPSSPEDANEDVKLIVVKTTKKLKSKQGTKTKHKVKKSDLFSKKCNKVTMPEIRCSAAQILSQNNNISSDSKKFFKSRSPEHLKKMNYVVPLSYKKSRLDFSESQNDSLKKPSENYLQHNTKICSNITLSPTVVKINANEEKLKTIQSDMHSFAEENNLSNSNGENTVLSNNLDKEIQVKDSDEGSDCIVDESNVCSKENTSAVKLYPVFYLKKEIKDESKCKISAVRKAFSTKDKSKGSEQMIIDAGQKEIGAKECEICKMPYTIGHAEDEKIHSLYHDNYLVDLKHGLKYPGWEKENQIGTYDDGVVIKLSDKHFKLKKFLDVLKMANRDLGIPNTDLPVSNIVNCLLFISNNGRVRGCLVAESISLASPMILHQGTWCASSASVPALCGINRVWVAKEYRRHKVASRMIDCLRINFIFGYAISVKELAFTDPTLNGRDFAASYTGTENFLVYK